MKNILFSLAIVFCYNVNLFAQDDAYMHITSRLKSFFTIYMPEKAYLQFDKPYYAAGDTIYFKAYVTEGEQHQLSHLSGVLHVELINTKNKVAKAIRLQIESGVCYGDFALPDSLPGGNYRVRSYTQWMRNRGEIDFFDRTIAVGALQNSYNEKTLSNQRLDSVVNNKPDIQFFPEGGSFVTGILTKVGFKVIASNGLGINVNGVILGETNKELCKFTSHLGMGYFVIKPEEGKTYKAKLTFADGTQQVVNLPKSEASGISLSVSNDSLDEVSITIAANDIFFAANQNKDFLLIIYSGGAAITASFKLDTSLLFLDVKKLQLHTGVATVTLFSPGGEPLCERPFFVQDNNQLNLQITTAKTIYTKREKVNLLLNLKSVSDSTFAGHFSASVIDESKVPADENNERNILTDLLLTSDLTGYVEQPNYYFNDTSAEARNNLDVLMLTQGYRTFEWRQVLDTNAMHLAYHPEKGLEINGRVTNLSGKPVTDGTVTLIPSNGDHLLSTKVNTKGKFFFEELAFMDSAKFILEAVNSKGKNNTKITFNKDWDTPPWLDTTLVMAQKIINQVPKVYLENSEQQQTQSSNYGFNKAKTLKEVKITAGRIQSPKITSYGYADQIVSGDKILYGGSLGLRLNGLIHFHNYFGKPVLIVVDGVEMPRDFDINSINTGAIKDVEAITDATASGPDYENILLINTIHGVPEKDIIPMGILPITLMGFYKARMFYSPRYDYTNISSKASDLRSTIYWNPEIKTGKDGNASLEYYNADGTGTYKVTIEGIDDNGNICRQVYRYKVE